MAVKLRLTRMGRRHRPFFRLNAVDDRTPRDGKVLERLGHYDPLEKDDAKQIVLKRDRIEYWLSQGAVPSDTVSEILLRNGIKHKYAEEKKARQAKARKLAHDKGKLFTATERILADKKKAAVEAEAAAAAAAAEAKAKAEAEEAKAKAEAEEAKAKEEEAKAKAKEEEAKAEEEEAKPETPEAS